VEGNGKRSLRRPKLTVIKGSSAPEEEDNEIPRSIPYSAMGIFSLRERLSW
jgi:hypothetical protein